MAKTKVKRKDIEAEQMTAPGTIVLDPAFPPMPYAAGDWVITENGMLALYTDNQYKALFGKV